MTTQNPQVSPPTSGPLPTACLEVQSIFVNTYQFSINPVTGRITFGESAAAGSTAEIRYRVAVTMATSDLKLFAEMILVTVKKAEEDLTPKVEEKVASTVK